MKIKVKCKIGELLDKEGRKQKWLAEKIDADRQQVNAWCKNRALPSIGYILRIKAVTGWDIDSMFELLKEDK